MLFSLLAITFLAGWAILGGVVGIVSGSAVSVVLRRDDQKVFEDGFLGMIGCFAGFFLGWACRAWIWNGSRRGWVWWSLVLAILLPLSHEISRRFWPEAALDFDQAVRGTQSKWNWLVLPLSFGASYEVLTWACWMPLAAHSMSAQDLPFVEGQVFAFAAIRIIAVLILTIVLFVVLPRAGCGE